MLQAQYQLIIVGGGPAGLTAGLYAARGRLKALLVEKGATGGQVLVTDWVDNYPGFVEGVSGFDLMDKMTAHADTGDQRGVADQTVHRTERRCPQPPPGDVGVGVVDDVRKIDVGGQRFTVLDCHERYSTRPGRPTFIKAYLSLPQSRFRRPRAGY